MALNFREVRKFLSIKRGLINLNIQISDIEDECIVRSCGDFTNLDRMIVVLEDKRYLRHRGIDWVSVVRILYQSFIGKRKGGASTIEMQLIRTISGRKEKTFSRKMNEFILAWLLNFRLDKLSMLYSYREKAFFGSHLDGAKIASSVMFGKAPTQLSLEEAAFLASMLVYPRPNVENDAWKYRVTRRARYGLSIYRKLEKRGDEITK